MKLRYLIASASGLVLALLARSAFAGVAVGITVAPAVPVVPAYAPVVVAAPPVVVAAPVIVPPAPVVVAPLPVAVRPVYAAPYYPAVTVRAGYWPRGVVVVH
ncbi:hypothetical protein [Paraburkholderia sp. J12]|uniref:hypothetical protein n=1 Tax=Paraburkholderia sp. J12 TaxID=2805432 RepID=UPI002ABE580B|nr:hypothetical protein [Paraburkholderia sp. J12]